MTDNPISTADRVYKIHSRTIVPSKMLPNTKQSQWEKYLQKKFYYIYSKFTM